MSDTILNILIKAVDQASETLNNISESSKKSFGDAEKASKGFALGLAAVGAAVGGFGYQMISAAADSEQTKIAFTTMLGSAEDASSLIKDLVQFARTTPFELKGLEASTKQVLAYGFTQKEILPNLEALGNIASGVGMDKLPNLILAFGQVKAATHLTGMELRQFTEAGVPLLDALSQEFKKPVAEIQKMISAGEVGFPSVQKALMSLSGEGGRFNDLMKNQSQSLNGMVSNLKDAWDIFLRGEGQQLLEWGKKFILLVTDIVQNHLPKWIEQIKSVIDFFGKHKEALIIVAGIILGALVPAIWAAITAFAAAAVALYPFMIAGAIIGGLVAGVYYVIKNWGLLSEFFKNLWKVITDSFKIAIDWIWDKLTKLAEFIVKIVDTITKPIKTVINTVSSIGSSVGGAIGGALKAIGLASGGIVTQPTFAMIGEAGPEAVIPLNKLGQSGGMMSSGSSGGGIVVNVNYPNVMDRNGAVKLADVIAKVLNQQLKLKNYS